VLDQEDALAHVAFREQCLTPAERAHETAVAQRSGQRAMTGPDFVRFRHRAEISSI
jgi:hypothetical protein